MRLIPDWKLVMSRAWSIRLLGVAGVLSGLEAALPFLEPFLPLPNGVLAIAAAIATGGAFVARLMAQANMEDPE